MVAACVKQQRERDHGWHDLPRQPSAALFPLWPQRGFWCFLLRRCTIILYLVPRRVAVPPRSGYMTRRPVTLSFLYDSSPRTELTTPTPECTHRRSLRCPWCVAGRCHVESARISFDVRRAVTWAPGRSTADPRPKRARLPLRFEPRRRSTPSLYIQLASDSQRGHVISHVHLRWRLPWLPFPRVL